MKDSAKYVKVVAWSEEDQCFVGSAPGLFSEAVTVTTKKRSFMVSVQRVRKGAEVIVAKRGQVAVRS